MDDEQVERMRTAAQENIAHCDKYADENYPTDQYGQAYLGWLASLAQAQATLVVSEELRRLREQRSGQ